ncbi:hypothetical protein GF339_08565 [candidate division KSB3 bacterium]|uniref:Peptidase S54 rhomboid domain-containing protein n=1 Tax=candidate division KSB3 bacterium TaxID=2044937 RepID=A0A9D5JVD4_9BACT|nr:hypothetical protein [candidate division KSB3 bacterium]MBD3324622.1 hypothetical protein [candidate division KSB3 bacterium]
MTLLDKLEKRFRGYGIPNLTLHLVIGQSLAYVLTMSGQFNLNVILLVPARVLEGEVWRLVTFLIVPPRTHPIFIFFALYLFYLMGTSLENYWGTFRYNIFLLIGYLATLGVSFLHPAYPASNVFLGGSIFLAFATLNPNFELALFFILPVKIKWLALITWIGYFLQLVFGGWPTRLLILASICNYLIFFGRDIALRMRAHRWRMERKAHEFARQNAPIHRCRICGITDKDDPDMTFRYCTKCDGTPCYCQNHIYNHEHITSTSNDADAE